MVATVFKGFALASTLLLAACSLASVRPLEAPVLTGDAQVTLLQTTDLHHVANGAGHVAAGTPGATGSYGRIAAYVEHVRGTAGHPVLLVDSGDWSMGTCYDLTLGQQPLAPLFLDALRYDCATLGNHEFDYGPGGLARILERARNAFAFATPLVASNTVLNGNGDLAPWLGPGKRVVPTHLTTLANGLKVGFLGLMGRDAAGAAPTAAPVRFTDYSVDYAGVQALVDDLRRQQGCHLVIALSHAGIDASGTSGEDVDLAKHVRGIDVIAAGHSHNLLATARTVTNGTWATRIISAGAYGGNVSRVELTYHPATGTTTLTASGNPAMTDATLAQLDPGLGADAAFGFLVGTADLRLNAALGDVFTRVLGWADYDPLALPKGLYHPVGSTDPELRSNNKDPVPGPNGLGNLCADAERTVPNLLLTRALLAKGWTGSAADPNLPAIRAQLQAGGFDPNPFQAAIVPTGVLRGGLPTGVALTFADVYNVLPLGASPDPAQALPVGYPLLSAYVTVADLRKVGALQLLGQTHLIPSDFYLHVSGLRFALKPPERYTYFKWATAAAVLAATEQGVAAGSGAALGAQQALGTLGADGGLALRQALLSGNPFAAAMINLNDPAPDGPQAAANLAVLAQVAGAAREASSLGALLLGKALEAVGEVAGFAPGDSACTGAATPLAEGVRHRLAASLYTLLMLDGVRARFGMAVTPYQGPTGSTALVPGDLSAALANRINLSPGGAPLAETKEWLALLLYLTTPPASGGHFLQGRITAEYASTSDPGQAARWGPAVGVRAATYPAAALQQFLATLAPLTGSLPPALPDWSHP